MVNVITMNSLWDKLPQEIQKVIIEFTEHMKITEYFVISVQSQLLYMTKLLRYHIENPSDSVLSERCQCTYYRNRTEMWAARYLYRPRKMHQYLHMCRLTSEDRMESVWKYVHSF